MIDAALNTAASISVAAILGAPFAVGKVNPEGYKHFCGVYYAVGSLLCLIAWVSWGSYFWGFTSATADAAASVPVQMPLGLDLKHMFLGWVCFLGYIASLKVYDAYAITPRLEAEKKSADDATKS